MSVWAYQQQWPVCAAPPSTKSPQHLSLRAPTIPSLNMEKNHRGTKRITIFNEHPKLDMFLQVWVPLPNLKSKLGFRGNIWRARWNQWKVMATTGTARPTWIMETNWKNYHICKGIKVPAQTEMHFDIEDVDVEPGAYAISIFGMWQEQGQPADMIQVGLVKWGPPNALNASEFYAVQLGKDRDLKQLTNDQEWLDFMDKPAQLVDGGAEQKYIEEIEEEHTTMTMPVTLPQRGWSPIGQASPTAMIMPLSPRSTFGSPPRVPPLRLNLAAFLTPTHQLVNQSIIQRRRSKSMPSTASPTISSAMPVGICHTSLLLSTPTRKRRRLQNESASPTSVSTRSRSSSITSTQSMQPSPKRYHLRPRQGQ